MIKKFSLVSASAILVFSNVVYGMDNKVQLKGLLEFQSIYYTNNGTSSQRKVSTYKKNFGFYSSGNVLIDYMLITDNNVKYGYKIGLAITTDNNRMEPFSLYTETNLGKFEAGSDKSAAQKMKITGYNSSCAVGNGWDAKVKTAPNSMIGYITNFASFLDTKMRTSGKVEYSRKVTYFTPKININDYNSMQFGISYIPDSSNMGNGDISDDERHTPVAGSQFAFIIKDGISYGLSYNGKLAEKSNLNIAFVGETGKAVGFDKNTGKKSDVKFKNLNSYTIGTEFIYDNCAISGSFGNYNKSLTAVDVDLISKKTYIYAAGAKYMWNPYAASLSHFYSNYKKNKLNATTLGVDYNISSGVKSYIQATYYQVKGRYMNGVALKFDNSHGFLCLIGGKVSL